MNRTETIRVIKNDSPDVEKTISTLESKINDLYSEVKRTSEKNLSLIRKYWTEILKVGTTDKVEEIIKIQAIESAKDKVERLKLFIN